MSKHERPGPPPDIYEGAEKLKEERIDILDESGQPTGETLTRREVHEQGAWHKTVHVFILIDSDEGKRILVHRRSKSKDLYPDTYDPVFGGHVESGSNAIETATTELQEELALEIVPEELQHMGNTKKDDPEHAPNDREHNVIMRCTITEDGLARIKIDADEIEYIQAFSVKDMINHIEQHPEQWRPTKEELLAELAITFPEEFAE